MRGRPAILGTALLGLVLAGCGMPPPGTSATIPPTQLPYGLDQQTARPTAVAPLPTLEQGPAVWLVREDALVPVAAPRVGADSPEPKTMADALIAQLANGPTETELGAGYRSALSPTTTLRVLRIEKGVARVDLNVGDTGLGGASQLPLAAGQIVLTLTSVPEVDAVQFRHRDSPISVPLPSGVLTTRPMTEADYLSLVDPRHVRTGRSSSGRPTP